MDKELLKIISVFCLGLIIGGFSSVTLFFVFNNHESEHFNVSEKRKEFIELKESIKHSMRSQEKYKCCLEKACAYCIEKTPKHGVGAECSCMEDVLEGKHPCGECIGEILEGHGNKMLAKYFASAIAEEVGVQHKGFLKQIVFEKYGVPVEEQV